MRVGLLLTFPTRTMWFTSKSSRQVTAAFSITTSVFCTICCSIDFRGRCADVMHFTSPIASPRLGPEHYCMPQRVAEGCVKVRSWHCGFLCYETVYSGRCLPSSGETHFLRHHIIPCKRKQRLLPTWWFQNIRLRGKAWCKQLIGSRLTVRDFAK